MSKIDLDIPQTISIIEMYLSNSKEDIKIAESILSNVDYTKELNKAFITYITYISYPYSAMHSRALVNSYYNSIYIQGYVQFTEGENLEKIIIGALRYYFNKKYLR